MDHKQGKPEQGMFGAASPELRELVRAVCEESLTAAQRDRLEELLRADEAARMFYLAHVDMNARIQFTFRGNVAAEKPTPRRAILPAGAGALASWFVPRTYTAWLLLLFVVGGGAALGYRQFIGSEPPATPLGASPYVAKLGRSVNVVWEGAPPNPANPVFMSGSQLRMKQGLVELTFSCGALMVVEGPADLKFESDLAVALRSGKVRAECPDEANGFTVRTPRANIVDRGTAFGASVDGQGRTEVQVFKGKVDTEVTDPSGQSSRFFQLSEGEALNIGDAKDAVVALSTNPNAFPRLPPLSSTELWNRWRNYRSQLLQDPDLMGYWSFDDKDARDLTPHHNDGFPMNSPAYSPKVPAAVGGGLCLDVSAGPKFVQVPHSKSLDLRNSMTIAFWLRGDNQQQDWSRVISKAGMMNCRGWVIHRASDLDQIRTVVGNRSHCNQSIADVKGVYDNAWHHLAVVLNSGSWQVYLDGEFYSHGTYRHQDEGLSSTGEMIIGAAGEDQVMVGSLDFEGQIDELCIFSRPLGADEIRRMCPAGEMKMQGGIAGEAALSSVAVTQGDSP